MTQVAGNRGLVCSVTSDAGFHGEIFSLRQNFLRTDPSMAFFALNLGVEMLFVAEQDEGRKLIYPDPGDGFTFLVIFGKCLNLRAVRLDRSVTDHAVCRRGNSLRLAVFREVMTDIAF